VYDGDLGGVGSALLLLGVRVVMKMRWVFLVCTNLLGGSSILRGASHAHYRSKVALNFEKK